MSTITYHCSECGEEVESEGLTVDQAMACNNHRSAIIDSVPTDSQPTVRPWKVDVTDSLVYIVNPGVALIAELDPDVDDMNAQANAELIVRCVNSHDALIAVARAVVQKYADNFAVPFAEAELLDAAQEALALAGE